MSYISNNNNNMMMNNMGRTMFNPYQAYNIQNRALPIQNYSLPHYESPMLHGRGEAENFAMGPNSSIFLPDEDQDIIWWIKTDANGAKTVTPFDINPHQEPVPVDLNSIEARLAAVEEWMNAKSNKSNASRRNNANINANANVGTGAATVVE